MGIFGRRQQSTEEHRPLTFVEARLARGDVVPEEDFARLVSLLPRQFTNDVIRAQSAFSRGQLAETIEALEGVRAVYAKQNAAILGDDPVRGQAGKAGPAREPEHLAARREKVTVSLREVDCLVSAVRLLQSQPPGRSDVELAQEAVLEFAAAMPSDFLLAFAEAQDTQARFAVLRDFCQSRPVGSAQDIENGMYVLKRGKDLQLVFLFRERHGDQIQIMDLLSQDRTGRMCLSECLQLAQARRVARLLFRNDLAARQASAGTAGKSGVSYCVMEGREFIQLLSASERTALTLPTELLKQAHNEFIAGHYEEVKSKLQAFSAEFERGAAHWLQEYREKVERYNQEKGALMSIARWQAEQAADQRTAEKIHSARRMLTLVLGGLEATKAAQRES